MNPPQKSSREPVIVVEHLTMQFGDNVILQDVSFEVFRGEIFVVVGASGCGKSTLFKNMIGLYKPTAGRIFIEGRDITTEDENALHHIRRTIGVLFQAGALIGSMTLADNVALPLMGHGHLTQAAMENIVKMKLAMVNLAGYQNHLPLELSGGMKKRAGLARAMALDPTILFFDEPNTGLDPVTSAELDLTIKAINRGMGTTMVIVSHDLASVMSVAHRVIMIDKSRKGIIAEGDPRDLKAHSRNPKVVGFFNRSLEGLKPEEASHGG